MTTNPWSHTYPSERTVTEAEHQKMSSLCSLTLWDQSVLAAVEVVGRSDIQQHRRCFVVMNVSSLWAQRYILGPVEQQGDCAGGCWDGTQCSLAIVDCVDAMIMFARLLGQNSLSHAEVNGRQSVDWKRYHKMCCFFSLWWLLSDDNSVKGTNWYLDLDSNRFFFFWFAVYFKSWPIVYFKTFLWWGPVNTAKCQRSPHTG